VTSIDYFELWEELDALPRDDWEALGALLRRGGDALSVAVNDSAFTGEASDDVLLAIFDDGAMAASLCLLAPERVTPTLREALAALDGRVFAGRGDLRPSQWDAAVRVNAALGYPGPRPDPLAAEGSRVTPEESAALWERWLAGTDVTSPQQLVRRPSTRFAFRRAQ